MKQSKSWCFPIICVVAATLLLLPGCSNPGGEDSDTPREFSWSSDTIRFNEISQTNLVALWGQNASTLIAVGHNSSSSAGTAYRFDGTNWNTLGFHSSEGGPISGALTFLDIDGVNSDELAIAGDERVADPNSPRGKLVPVVVLKQGSSWTKIEAPSGSFGLAVTYGLNSEVWVGLDAPFVYRRANQVWSPDSLPLRNVSGSTLRVSSLCSDNLGQIYANVQFLTPTGLILGRYFLRRTESDWQVLDSASDSRRWGDNGIWISPSNRIYSVGGAVHEYSGGVWQSLFESPDGVFTSIDGTSDDDLIVVGNFGQAFGYDGQRWSRLDVATEPGILFTDVWVQAHDAFLLGSTDLLTIVFHGKR